MTIRLFRNSDLPHLYAANVASVPGVGAETMESLSKWIGLSTCLVATDAEDIPLGFITIMALGQDDYDSPNMRWFETYAAGSGKAVVYVDRIALQPEARGQGYGEALYQAAFEHFRSADEIGCEVNTLPPNPGSHRFHQRLGFVEVGQQTYIPGAKAVAFYARALD